MTKASFLPLVLLPLSISFSHAQLSGDRDTDFKIVLERRTEKPDGFQANITTTSVYPCVGYVLRTRVTWERDTVSIRILGLVRPAPCVHGYSEATARVFIGEMKEGVSFIRIYYRGEANLHKIFLSKRQMFIMPIRRSFTDLSGN